MAIESAASAAGIREVLNLPASHEATLSPYAARGDRRVRKEVGSTLYDATLAETADGDEADAVIFAANRYGAAQYVLDRAKSAGSRGIVAAIQVGEMTETLAGVREAREWACALRNEATEALKDEGIWQRPALVAGTLIEVDDEDDDA